MTIPNWTSPQVAKVTYGPPHTKTGSQVFGEIERELANIVRHSRRGQLQVIGVSREFLKAWEAAK